MTEPNAETPSNGFDCSGAKDGDDANDSHVRETRLERCSKCRFWGKAERYDIDSEGSGLGVCRRSAPVATPSIPTDEEEEAFAVWPCTHSDDWCGDFQAKNDTV